MKKLLSVLICIVMIFGVFACMTASAETNYCELFDRNVKALRWAVELNGGQEVAEGQGFSAKVIIDYIRDKTANAYYDDETYSAVIPASVFEAKAKKCFAIVDINALRSFEYEYMEDGEEGKRPYNAEKDAYIFMMGGLGDSTTYVIRGYVRNGSKYTVYSHFVDLACDEVPANAVEGKDYVVVDGNKCAIMHSLKNVVETDGTDVKFHSWQRTDSFPELSALVTPSTKFDDKPASSSSSKPSSSTQTSTPSTSKPTSSKTESAVTSSAVSTTSSEDTSSVEEEKPLTVVAETEGAKLETEENVFPENTVVKVEMIEEDTVIKTIKTALKEISETFVAYEITAFCDNVSVQPDGKVKATFDIPEGYDMSRVAVFYVAPDGTTEKLSSIVDKESGTVVAELSHFSTYVVAETDEVQESETTGAIEETDEDKGGFPIWIIIVIVAVLAIGGGVAAFFVLKNKKA